MHACIHTACVRAKSTGAYVPHCDRNFSIPEYGPQGNMKENSLSLSPSYPYILILTVKVQLYLCPNALGPAPWGPAFSNSVSKIV